MNPLRPEPPPPGPPQEERHYGFHQQVPPQKTFPTVLFLICASVFALTLLVGVRISTAFSGSSSSPEPAVAAAPPPSARAEKPSPKPVLVKMPNLVGRNHQEAQDLLQSKGFVKLREHDATGQGRLLIWDRNWVVVSQTPAPGTRVDPEHTKVTLNSRKKTE
ncbi:PASTA domain-containing protein [Actinocorallia longicatena]|uniref:PASTA domain-containing protein n=1 Tax=Actinocorallia longicatena TaxID=111803 RepID=A0ABP6QNM0_9ACTN